ncbi:MAG: methyltransferase domain-containing protein [Phenylobacterium sp.]|uniref:class I SAM-dependent methyltransferase n=1 Tax=Phenylobacterium sp. TaxID=1871053 RepID=UPI001A53FA04|nr:class I SAM-dependent methyltransferase [Phenylobacterium sp.]MBL8772249.1 methyltransferase domain-containing protein [Phenylobacterium sp.]
MTKTDTPNRSQADAWNDASGRAWAEMQDMLDRMLAPFEATLTQAAFPGAGRRVVDIGCGAGATTLAMARRLGPDGLITGVDISGPLVAVARARADAEGLRAGFIQADAQTHAFEAGTFDAAISRFGVMFFDDPVAAFANIRRALRPGGTLTFEAWRSPMENGFMVSAAMAAAPFLPAMKPPAPDAPGQFGFADGARVRRILDAAGWRDVEVAPLDMPCEVPEADLMAYATRLGPAGAALKDADAATRAKVTEALMAAFRPFVRDGAARYTAACWLVTARA